MATADDRRAALVLLGLAAAGLGVRIVTGGTAAPGAVAYRPVSGDRPAVESTAARAAALARPLAAGETIDVDVASADELVRLPRVGPGAAARIVRDREVNGPFGSLAGLERVTGLGATTLAALRPHAVFSGRPRAAAAKAVTPPRVRINTASAEELTALPGIGPRLADAIVEDRTRRGPFRTPQDLARVAGIGPGLVRRLEARILVP
jgi:competence ComEA-like helix-hairpin-helix protein